MRVFTGYPQEVCHQLEHLTDGQIYAVVLEESNQREIEVKLSDKFSSRSFDPPSVQAIFLRSK